MEVSVVRGLGGKEREVTLARTGEATGMEVATSQVLIPWMDLRDPTGGEKM